jgi:hypothetical protein
MPGEQNIRQRIGQPAGDGYDIELLPRNDLIGRRHDDRRPHFANTIGVSKLSPDNAAGSQAWRRHGTLL